MFGTVEGEVVRLSSLGEVAAAEWARTVEARGGVVPDVSVVMPNHVHLLFGVVGGDDRHAPLERRGDTMHGVPTHQGGAEAYDARRRFGEHDAGSVSSIVGAFKAATTRQARRLGLWAGGSLWQGRFHDRVVRSDAEADRIRRYITENPARWADDRFHPAHPSNPGNPSEPDTRPDIP